MAAAARAKAVPIDIERAIEVFVRGFAFTRSFTHPYVAESVGPLWVTRDAPRKGRADYRREEWMSPPGVAPAEVDRLARQGTRGAYAICAFRRPDEPDGELRTGYKAIGYRLGVTEPLMAHPLQRVPRLAEPYHVTRVTTPELADRLAKQARSRQLLPEHLKPDSPLRQYVALDGDLLIGWVKSIAVGDATWVSNMYVAPEYRRRGVGRSMLVRMLRDDRAAGATCSVLTASHTGALLYPVVGYELVGELLLFTPKRR